MKNKGGGLCDELELDLSPFSPRVAGRLRESSPQGSIQNFELQKLQKSNKVAITLDRCTHQKNGLVANAIGQILATCEGKLPPLLNRLRDIKERLEKAENKNDVIQQLLAADIPESDEFGHLVKSIIGLSFQGAQQTHADIARNRADIARNKLIANSDEQARKLAPIITELKDAGASSLRELADGLNERNIRTKNGHIWYSSTVRLLVQKIDELQEKNSGIRL